MRWRASFQTTTNHPQRPSTVPFSQPGNSHRSETCCLETLCTSLFQQWEQRMCSTDWLNYHQRTVNTIFPSSRCSDVVLLSKPLTPALSCWHFDGVNHLFWPTLHVHSVVTVVQTDCCCMWLIHFTCLMILVVNCVVLEGNSSDRQRERRLREKHHYVVVCDSVSVRWQFVQKKTHFKHHHHHHHHHPHHWVVSLLKKERRW